MYRRHIASDDTMVDELEGIRSEAIVDQSSCYPGICLEGLKKTTKHQSKWSMFRPRFETTTS
jgi:hypothetical protein